MKSITTLVAIVASTLIISLSYLSSTGFFNPARYATIHSERTIKYLGLLRDVHVEANITITSADGKKIGPFDTYGKAIYVLQATMEQINNEYSKDKNKSKKSDQLSLEKGTRIEMNSGIYYKGTEGEFTVT